ncbi:DnaJ domain-containing protein [bacterium]|nr:DnaJ domain-containing protein [bacterium]
MERNYYEILGIEKDASTEQIREAYREIARVYHPDSNFYDEILDEALPPEAMDKFKEITSAYNTLVNEEKRKLYDETLPPELTTWESGEESVSHSDWVKKKVRSSGVYAMGQFGSVPEEPEESEHEEELHSAPRSVNEHVDSSASWFERLRRHFSFSRKQKE